MTIFDRAVNVAKDIENEPKFKLKQDYWKNSKFYNMIQMPSSTKGRFGEELVQKCFLNAGYNVTASESRESDFCISYKQYPPIPIEVKTSFLWLGKKNHQYKFQRIR